jgi:FKBP-type peptidyl-prolyl cis-trans isomerase SlyD
MSDTIKQGMVVSISYTLNDENGDLFEYRELPVSYLHGAGIDLFPKIEQALSGKSIGDEVCVTLSPEEGFGLRDPELQFTDSLVNVP